MVKQELLIRVLEERKSRKSGERFYVLQTDKGDFTCFEPPIMNELDKCIGKTVEVETEASGKYNNIRQFYRVVEEGQKNAPEKAGTGEAKIEMLVSYAKDLVVAGKEDSMENAIKAVIEAYKKASGEL